MDLYLKNFIKNNAKHLPVFSLASVRICCFSLFSIIVNEIPPGSGLLYRTSH